jgi:hypothetical protein
MAHQLESGVSETQKLVGVSNYNVWQLKISYKKMIYGNDVVAFVQINPKGGLVVQVNQAAKADLIWLGIKKEHCQSSTFL